MSPLRVGLKFIINNNYYFIIREDMKLGEGQVGMSWEGSWKEIVESGCDQNILYTHKKISKKKSKTLFLKDLIEQRLSLSD